MANQTYDRRCSICFSFLTLARRARHPTAKTCGASPCQTEHGAAARRTRFDELEAAKARCG